MKNLWRDSESDNLYLATIRETDVVETPRVPSSRLEEKRRIISSESRVV